MSNGKQPVEPRGDTSGRRLPFEHWWRDLRAILVGGVYIFRDGTEWQFDGEWVCIRGPQ